VIYLGFS